MPVHILNAISPIDDIPEGICNLVKDLHPAKAITPMERTLSGMVIETKLSHIEKAESPIHSSPSGKSTFFKHLHCSNVDSSIILTLEGMTISTKSVPANAPPPTCETLSGRSICFRPL